MCAGKGFESLFEGAMIDFFSLSSFLFPCKEQLWRDWVFLFQHYPGFEGIDAFLTLHGLRSSFAA